MPQVLIPTRRRKVGRDHPLWWVSYQEAVGSLVRTGGVWSLVQAPLDEDTREGVLRGGFVNRVDAATASELVRDGFGDWVVEDPSVYSQDWSGDYFGETS